MADEAWAVGDDGEAIEAPLGGYDGPVWTPTDGPGTAPEWDGGSAAATADGEGAP